MNTLHSFLIQKNDNKEKKYNKSYKRLMVNGYSEGLMIDYRWNNEYDKQIYKLINNRNHGEYQNWDINGKLLNKRYPVNGLIQNENLYWSENGQLTAKLYHINGRFHGEYRRWYENGQLKDIGYDFMSKTYGECREWYDNGQLREKSYWVNGKRKTVNK